MAHADHRADEVAEERVDLWKRGREFAYEMHRREDLIRFGKFGDAWWEKDASDPKRELFPIPFEVITANPALTQNPGY